MSFVHLLCRCSSVVVDPDAPDEGWSTNGRQLVKSNPLKTIYGYTKYVWILFALTSLILQASREVEVSDMHQRLMEDGELALTIAFDVEIIWRVLAELPDWRAFFFESRNLLDLSLAVISTVIQIPFIHESPSYVWFTIFQLARFYRVILVVPRMRPLLVCIRYIFSLLYEKVADRLAFYSSRSLETCMVWPT